MTPAPLVADERQDCSPATLESQRTVPMGKITTDAEVASLQGRLRDLEIQKAALESELALLLRGPQSDALPNPPEVVKSIYTYDVEDEADCTRVREALRSLGVAWKIPYKGDLGTYAGRYSKRGDARISKRYE